MLLPLLLAASLSPTPVNPEFDKAAREAESACRSFVAVRLGTGSRPDEIKASLLPKREGQWLVDGKVKGPEGPLLFACHLHQGKRWELLNFSLWAPQPIKPV